MATLQTVFDYMEVIDRELALQSAEADVAKGISSYNFVKDLFEAILASEANILQSTVGTVTTTASTEATAFPSGVLRIDSLWFLDGTTSLPVYELDEQYDAGSHAGAGTIPLFQASTSTTGQPTAYFTDGTNIRWSPTPDATHTVRYYGFAETADLTAAGDTFPYPNYCRPYFATMMAKVFQLGIGDPMQDYEILARETFQPAIDTMKNFKRTGARPATLRYRAHY